MNCQTKKTKISEIEEDDDNLIRIDTKIKDFGCEKCNFKCSTNSDLQRHIKTCVGDEVGSSGEVKIKKVLNEMKIDYEYDSSHEVRSDKGLLRWDFIITSCEEPLFIEYDGRQHFEPVSFGGMSKEQANEAFEKTKKYDKLKDDYCNDNGYLLLRIPYTEYKNIETLVEIPILKDSKLLSLFKAYGISHLIRYPRFLIIKCFVNQCPCR